ncbi:MAG TPA: HD-GYP domain-containing protein [Gammaproteobacteria bacterium]
MADSPAITGNPRESDASWRLHRLLLRRIGAAALLIAATLAALVYALEQKRLSGLAVDLAVQRAAQFTAMAGDVLTPGAVRGSEVQARLDRFTQDRLPPRDGRIVVARIYSVDGRELAQYAYADHPQAPAATAFLTTQSVRTDIETETGTAVDIAGQRQIFVQLPLRTADGAKLGSVAAVYAPSRIYLAELRARQWRVVIAAVGIVLITTAILYPVIVRLMGRVVRLSEELLDANLEMLSVVGSAIAKRDADTDAHNYRVTIYSVRLAEAVGLDVRTMQALIKGAFLHDVGKIGIPDHILLKPGKLDAAEFAEMQKHVAHGLDIVQRAAWLADAEAVVGAHHEKYDGGGYGNHLQADDIPLTARIFAIADVFDALTSHRPYKLPLAYDAAMEILEQGRGTHFDPRLLDAFAGIARPLHETFADRDDEHPRQVLRDIVVRYFKQDIEVLLS